MNKQTSFPIASRTRSRRTWVAGATFLLALAFLLIQGCGRQGAFDQKSFDSAEKAVDALVVALRANDMAQLKQILGPQSEDILFSGDAVDDKGRVELFLKTYDEKHQLVAEKDGVMTLTVGNTDWPLPIPVVQSGGKWVFDTEAGEEEMLDRRIGRNELSAIQTCLAYRDAQREYAALDPDGDGRRDYATKFLSDEGKKNGLFWPTAENEPPSPLGLLVAAATEEGYKPGDAAAGPQPYHGYRYRILTAQGANAPGGVKDYLVGGKLIGGFAIVAWPADYENSGIMTLIMNHQGVVYQRDLGEDTAKIAEAMSGYDPGPDWQTVEPGSVAP